MLRCILDRIRSYRRSRMLRCPGLFYEWLYENHPQYRRDRSSYARPEVRRMWELFQAGYNSR